MLSILSIPAPENASAGSPQQSFFYQKVLHLLDNLPCHDKAVTGGFFFPTALLVICHCEASVRTGLAIRPF